MDPPQTPEVPLGALHEAQSLDGSEKRKRQPRNSACQACATLKMKCVPGPVVGKCERLDVWQPGTASVRTRCKLPIARVDDRCTSTTDLLMCDRPDQDSRLDRSIDLIAGL
ncbi:hypothetical protein LTR94_012245 [Friedmanniomyces endolithicus]|nr:hypothetical protein LTR94_012245 [Friedmanniomyces endolithicus]KAK0839249.1 hypothetical protein LTR03_011406 [Friedmanniomyces endolithicus]